uniref:Ras association domain-containing protein 2 n=1 Tax=Cacopsylla melanoneura TaxID=428564 RepID=A0A8D8YTB8_9HEMI
MWKCHKCGKPVYFAERKQSLGYDWHPECLRCEECGKRLNPGQHAEHKGVPYCHVPCYGALFGPQLFGHGTRVESHTSFGKVENKQCGSNMPRSHLESKLSLFNQYYDGKSGEIRSREVNGRLVLEGALRIHWGITGVIHLKEDDDQRVVVTIRKRNSMRSESQSNGHDDDLSDSDTGHGDSVTSLSTQSSLVTNGSADHNDSSIDDSSVSDSQTSGDKYLTLPSRLEDVEKQSWDEFDDLLMVERPKQDGDKLYQTMPTSLPSGSLTGTDTSTNDNEADSSSLPYHSIHSSDSLETSTLSLENNDTLADSSDIELDSYSLHFEDRIEDRTDTNSASQPDQLMLRNSNGTEGSGHATYTIHNERSSDSTNSSSEVTPRNAESQLTPPTDEGGTVSTSELTLRNESEQVTNTNTNTTSEVASSRNEDYSETNSNHRNSVLSNPEAVRNGVDSHTGDDNGPVLTSEGGVEVRRRKGSTAIKRRPGGRRHNNVKLKRRCSINGHFYNRETSVFTPPHGSVMSVWLTSLVSPQEVINLVLDKYKVESTPHSFALFVVRDNGEQRRLRDDEYPLLVRVMLGPHEDVAKLYIMDRRVTDEISNDVAQFLNLSVAECRAIMDEYNKEEEIEIKRNKAK